MLKRENVLTTVTKLIKLIDCLLQKCIIYKKLVKHLFILLTENMANGRKVTPEEWPSGLRRRS